MEKLDFNPLVSIIIPVYNGENYLKEAIDSALAQTYKNIEIIVVNDGSIDKTEKIVQSYGKKIRYLKKQNGGVATALNLGIKEAKGEYISWLSHDDVYYPDKIQCQINFLRLNTSKKIIIFTNYTKIDKNGKITATKKIARRSVKNIKCLLAIDTIDTLNGCTLLLPKSILPKKNPFNPKLKFTQDYDLWFKLLQKNEFSYLDKFLIYSRQHANQTGLKNPIDSTTEADILHASMIKKLKLTEIKKYCNNSTDFLLEHYNVYKKANYIQTAATLLKKIIELLYLNYTHNIDTLKKIFNETIFDFENYLNIKNTLLPLLNPYCEKNSPRILVYTNVWFRGGIEKVLSIVLPFIAKKYHVILVTTNEKSDGSFLLDNSVTHIKISKNNPDEIAKKLLFLSVILDIDIFIGNPNFIEKFLSIYKYLNKLKIKSIAWNHNSYFLPCLSPWLYPVFAKRSEAFTYANFSVWPTKFATYAYSILNKNGIYIPNPNTIVSSSSTMKDNNKNILCVGRFYDLTKRLDKAFIVFKKVLKNHPDAKLILVGKYDENIIVPDTNGLTFKSFLKKMDIPSKNLVFLGEKNNLNEIYEQSSIFLLTSESEGFALVLNEAGSFEIPSLIFDVPGLEDIIIDGENGFIVEQNDYDKMANKMDLLLKNKKLRLKMGRKAKKLTERFDSKKICQKWLKLIETVLLTNTTEDLNHPLNYINNKKFIVRLSKEYEKNINSIMKYYYAEQKNNICSNKKWNEKKILDKIYSHSIMGHILVRIYLRFKKILKIL